MEHFKRGYLLPFIGQLRASCPLPLQILQRLASGHVWALWPGLLQTEQRFGHVLALWLPAPHLLHDITSPFVLQVKQPPKAAAAL